LLDRQEQLITIYRPTVHLQTLIRTQIVNQQYQAGNKNYVEMNVVSCNSFFCVWTRNTNHELANNRSCVSTISIVTRLQL